VPLRYPPGIEARQNGNSTPFSSRLKRPEARPARRSGRPNGPRYSRPMGKASSAILRIFYSVLSLVEETPQTLARWSLGRYPRPQKLRTTHGRAGQGPKPTADTHRVNTRRPSDDFFSVIGSRAARGPPAQRSQPPFPPACRGDRSMIGRSP
jgi:hypothetical protein